MLTSTQVHRPFLVYLRKFQWCRGGDLFFATWLVVLAAAIRRPSWVSSPGSFSSRKAATSPVTSGQWVWAWPVAGSPGLDGVGTLLDTRGHAQRSGDFLNFTARTAVGNGRQKKGSKTAKSECHWILLWAVPLWCRAVTSRHSNSSSGQRPLLAAGEDRGPKVNSRKKTKKTRNRAVFRDEIPVRHMFVLR